MHHVTHAALANDDGSGNLAGRPANGYTCYRYKNISGGPAYNPLEVTLTPNYDDLVGWNGNSWRSATIGSDGSDARALAGLEGTHFLEVDTSDRLYERDTTVWSKTLAGPGWGDARLLAGLLL